MSVRKKYYCCKRIQRKFIESLLKIQWSIKNLFVQKNSMEQ